MNKMTLLWKRCAFLLYLVVCSELVHDSSGFTFGIDNSAHVFDASPGTKDNNTTALEVRNTQVVKSRVKRWWLLPLQLFWEGAWWLQLTGPKRQPPQWEIYQRVLDVLGIGLFRGKRSIYTNFNEDYGTARRLLNTPEVRNDPILRKILKISRNGFRCDRSFCQKFNNMQSSLGICTSYFCHCSC